MATQVITRTLCDFCQADDVETPDAVRIVITIDSDRWEVDVCDPHGTPLRAFGETLSEHGRKVPVRGMAASLAAGATNDGDEVACPACGKTYKNRSSLGSHSRGQHGKTLGQLFGRDTGFSLTCDDCGRTFDTPQGIAVHKNRMHPSESPSESPDEAGAKK